ncbi:MAG TPA: ABC transporter transmembrane domain-containing protein, partial [Acetobacteraceae bacterium]
MWKDLNEAVLRQRMRADRDVPQVEAPSPAALKDVGGFIRHYVRGRPGHFLGIMALVAGAAGAAVGTQWVMKLLVDAMAGPVEWRPHVWTALVLFVVLIAAESILWRCTGWLTCRTTVGIGVDMRLDLFAYLNGQPMRYFAENLAGSLGQRITATAGHFGALANTVIWRILPPCVDFVGALIIFATINAGM